MFGALFRKKKTAGAKKEMANKAEAGSPEDAKPKTDLSAAGAAKTIKDRMKKKKDMLKEAGNY